MAALKVLSSLVLFTASAFALKGAVGGGSGDAPLDPPPPVNTVFAGVLLRIGLPADTIACAGVGSGSVASMIGAARTLYSEAQLATLDQSFVNAKSTRDQLVRKVRSGLATAAEKASLPQAEASFASADAARASYLAGMLNAALATVSADQINAYLDTLETNVLGNKITEKRVEGWQAAAKGMRRIRLQPAAPCADHPGRDRLTQSSALRAAQIGKQLHGNRWSLRALRGRS